ncbi:MAG: hypothetical protein IJ639_08060, partial [Ruminococcus sp.]|nr:hypothetical protein [Ruminococcus sp.]
MKKKSMVRRVTAMLLVLVMAMSIAASSVVTASAAKQSNSIDAGSIAKDIASGYVKEIVDATAGSNPVTSVLGSVGLDLFNKMLNGSESKPAGTDEILDQVNALKHKMEAYHAEEMSALKVLSHQMELLNNISIVLLVASISFLVASIVIWFMLNISHSIRVLTKMGANKELSTNIDFDRVPKSNAV